MLSLFAFSSMHVYSSMFSTPIEKSLIFSFALLVSLSLTTEWCDAEQEVNTRFERGVRYLDAEQYDLALAEFQSIEKEFKTSADISSLAQYYIGFVHQELNDLSPAASAYQKALALKAPQEVHGNAHLHLGIVYKSHKVSWLLPKTISNNHAFCCLQRGNHIPTLAMSISSNADLMMLKRLTEKPFA